ncbi:MAG: T9SS type A sorting domain-containing protein [Saprospiraceae bacterium]
MRFTLLILYSLIQQIAPAQLYDNTWMMGCCYTPISRLNGGINITFDKGYADTSYYARKVSFLETSISISNPITGNLMFYSNGCNIFNRLDNIMELGDEINPGSIQQMQCEDYGYDLAKGGAILPNSGNSNKYYVIHRAYDDTGKTVDRLYYSEVDLSFNQGLGRVIKKNVPMLEQRMYRGQFDIVKHANGLDYWILAYNYNSDTVFRFLANADGIHGAVMQYFPIQRKKVDSRAHSTISSDGTKAVRIDPHTGLFIMDFDRESGLFSNLKQYNYWSSIDSSPVTSVAFSPNNKLLYVSNRWRLYQFDLESDEIENSRILIDTFDYFSDPYPIAFYLMQLAPDGKIYMNCTNGVSYLHTIHKPNEKGKACEFRQHDFNLPAQNAFTMPYFPNYKLGAVTAINHASTSKLWELYPNPNHGSFIIQLYGNSHPNARLMIYNLNGQLMYETIIQNDSQSVNVNLSSGIYIFKLVKEDGTTNTQKLIID